jgi:hypothetical protein
MRPGNRLSAIAIQGVGLGTEDAFGDSSRVVSQRLGARSQGDAWCYGSVMLILPTGCLGWKVGRARQIICQSRNNDGFLTF